MAPNYRGILFDLDGTLVDSIELILSSFRHTMSTHLGRMPPDEEWLRTLGRPMRVQMGAFARSAAELEAMIRTYVAHNQANHEVLVRPFPGMSESVARLRQHGYRLAVVTSKLRQAALRELDTCGLDGMFEGVVSASDVERPKPDPQPVELGVETLEMTPGEVLFVGDSIFDLEAGRAADVDTAAALWGPFVREQLAPGEPDYWLEHIEELLDLLGMPGRDG